MIHIFPDIMACSAVLIPITASSAFWGYRCAIAIEREQRLRQSAVDQGVKDRTALAHAQDRLDRAVLEAARARRERDTLSGALEPLQADLHALRASYVRLTSDPLIQRREAVRRGDVVRREGGRFEKVGRAG